LDNRRWVLPDFGELTTEQFDRTFKTNAYAMFRLTKAH
jgi:hypothetical protein